MPEDKLALRKIKTKTDHNEYFIGNCAKTSTLEDITNYLQDNGIVVGGLRTTIKSQAADSTKNCYILRSSSDPTDLLNPENWPVGISCHKFKNGNSLDAPQKIWGLNEDTSAIVLSCAPQSTYWLTNCNLEIKIEDIQSHLGELGISTPEIALANEGRNWKNSYTIKCSGKFDKIIMNLDNWPNTLRIQRQRTIPGQNQK